MATSIPNKPSDTIRERGGLKGTIWKQVSQDGRTYYDVEFSRTYRDDAGFHDSRYLREGDILTLSRLAVRVYDRIRELKAQDAAETADVETGETDLGGAA